MKQFFFLFLNILIATQYSQAETENRSEKTISLLTSSPSSTEIYTAWGHTAIRIKSPSEYIDLVFNYGIFSFDKHFIYKFVKGETDYRLGISSFEQALEEAKEKNVFLYEQELNLTDKEKDLLFIYLLENYKPENRYYRYNFFFDNCATRPRDIIEKTIQGDIIYPKIGNTQTFREIIYSQLSRLPWYTFGIDLCLGSPTDRKITDRELMFLPEELMRIYKQSIIQTENGLKPLVINTNTINEPQPEKTVENNPLFSPLSICWLFFFLVLLHTFFYNYKKRNDLWFDVVLFFIYGMLGCIIFFLSFISEHPCTSPNYNLLWSNPLQFIFAIMVLFRKLRKQLVLYQIINLFLLSIAVIGWFFIPQNYNSAFLPLILILILRSYNYIQNYR